MPADDLYWNPMELDDDVYAPVHRGFATKPYVDPWDLENYAYIRQHLDDSVDLNSSNPSSLGDLQDTSASAFYYVPTSINKKIPKSPDYFYAPPIPDLSERFDPYADIEDTRKIIKRKIRTRESMDYEADNERSFDEVAQTARIYEARKEKSRRRVEDLYGYPPYQSDLYCSLGATSANSPIYDSVINARQPSYFRLSNYGHLQIDYTSNWNKLNKYIYH